MSKNASEIFYLVDHKKIDRSFNRIYGDLSKIDHVISDYDFSTETMEAFPSTKFTNVNKE